MVLRAVTDEIMYALMELSGQEYVDVYAQKAKSRGRADLRLTPPGKRVDLAAGAERPGVTSGSGPDGA
jgi:1-acyl-sn-glycerol-3-phosphate acyltransferase